MILSKGASKKRFVTLRDISQGLVTAPRSHAVIIMDLRGKKTTTQIYFMEHSNFFFFFLN